MTYEELLAKNKQLEKENVELKTEKDDQLSKLKAVLEIMWC